MRDVLSLFSPLCNASGLAWFAQGGVLVGLLVAGAVGSIAHCGPMCGPFVVAQVAGRLARVPAAELCERHRFQAGALLPYHCGRVGVYAALGALAAGVGAAITAMPWFTRLGGVALLLAACLFADQAARHWLPRRGRSSVAFSAGLRGPAVFLSRMSRGGRGFFGEMVRGAALGFLPCGFLYAALAVAAGSGAIWRGALAMAVFGLGTMPALIALGIAGGAAGRALRDAVRTASPVIFAVNAMLLLMLGLTRLLA